MTENIVERIDRTANPAPLGLAAFGMTTVLLNLHNAGFFAMGSMILAMGIFYGGLAQVVAGLMEWKKGNTFGTVAFSSYGFFWLSFVTLLILPEFGFTASDDMALASYLAMWGGFTLFLFVGTFRMNKATQGVFGLLATLFFMLAISHYFGNGDIGVAAGYLGVFLGLLAMYAGLAQVINENYGQELFPLGSAKKMESERGSSDLSVKE